MPVIPQGSLSLTLANVKALIAASPGWQSWVTKGQAFQQVIDPSGAANSIYLIGLPLPAQITVGHTHGYTIHEYAELRPFCLINFQPKHGTESTQIAPGTFVDSARVLFSFEDNVPDEDAGHYQDVVLNFLNNVGAVIDGMKEKAGTDGLANLHNLRVEINATRANETEIGARGDYHMMMFSAEINAI